MTDPAAPPGVPIAMSGLTAADLEQLLAQFNESASRLYESHSRLQARVEALTRELEEKNQELQRKKRLEALGEMAAGVAHEIRNPLGGIQLYVSMLDKDLSDRPELQGIARKITDGVRHLNGIVEGMLAFTRNMTPQLRPGDVHRLLEEALALAGIAESRTIGLRRKFAPDMPSLPLDPGLMSRAFLNVIRNAQEAMETGGGGLTIATALQGDTAVITFTDTGPGIPPDALDKIFNPFFTCKDKGTGLGLAIVHRIVESHRGTIQAANGPAGGAVFTIRLPARPPAPRVGEAA